MPQPCFDSLEISGLRNIRSASIQTNKVNVIHGQNGSGKSSLLEAIYYLVHAKSCRTSKAANLIQHNQEQLTVFARITTNSGSISAGISRDKNGKVNTKLNHETATSAIIAKNIPTQFIDTQCHTYFTDGPQQRRQYLNWGLFHMKQNFFSIWKNYNQTLRQRNAALKAKSSIQIISAWDVEYISLCEQIHSMRAAYIDQLKPIINNLLNTMLGTSYSQLTLRYNPGWNPDKPLAFSLQEKITRDLDLGYSQLGAHRADLQLYFKNTPAHEYLSQGQLKLASYALKIAQCILHKEQHSISSVFLIDDLQAELDPRKQKTVINLLTELDSQCFYTALDHAAVLTNQIKTSDINQFTINGGIITQEELQMEPTV